MQGYIHQSTNSGQKGFITCCNVSDLNKTFSFGFADCSDALRTSLMAKNVMGVAKGQCPNVAPGGIKVTFDRKTPGGFVAENVR